MGFTHGVYTFEEKSSETAFLTTESCLPFVVGIAPINTCLDDENHVNEVFLCSTLAEAKTKLGFEKALPIKGDANNCQFRYSLCEFMNAWYTLYNGSRALFVNVLDPAKHKKAAETKTIQIDAKTGLCKITELGIIPSSFKIQKPKDAEGEDDEGEEYYSLNHEYTVGFDDDGAFIITSLKDGIGSQFLLDTSKPLTIQAEVLNPNAITAEDIIGGYDSIKKKNTGFELLEDAKAKYRLMPTLLVAPNASCNPTVAAVMGVKARDIDGVYNAIALIDAPTETVREYSDVVSWKNENSVTNETQFLTWPCVRMGKDIYHYSSHLAGLINKTDNEHNGVPYASPSNKLLQCNGLCLYDGTEVLMGFRQANNLNEQGITTAINEGGFRAWGNRTACYPFNTDTKDNFLCVKRMFFWIRNNIAVTMISKVDEPGNRTLIENVLTSTQLWLNSLMATGALNSGAKITFPIEQNAEDSIMNGIYHFKLMIAPPTPAETLEFAVELDTKAYASLAANSK